MSYYHSITEVHASQTPSGESVKELLGISNNYNPLYENTLRLIPNSAWTIHDIDWRSPIAKSSRSAVYAATLRRQRTVLSTSECGDEAVVLKDVIPQSTREITDNFMKEVKGIENKVSGQLLITMSSSMLHGLLWAEQLEVA